MKVWHMIGQSEVREGLFLVVLGGFSPYTAGSKARWLGGVAVHDP